MLSAMWLVIFTGLEAYVVSLSGKSAKKNSALAQTDSMDPAKIAEALTHSGQIPLGFISSLSAWFIALLALYIAIKIDTALLLIPFRILFIVVYTVIQLFS